MQHGGPRSIYIYLITINHYPSTSFIRENKGDTITINDTDTDGRHEDEDEDEDGNQDGDEDGDGDEDEDYYTYRTV